MSRARGDARRTKSPSASADRPPPVGGSDESAAAASRIPAPSSPSFASPPSPRVATGSTTTATASARTSPPASGGASAPSPVAPSSFLNKVYVDCSSLGPRAIEIAAAFYGADKILFGTDCPIFLTDWSQDAVANANLSVDDKHAIREGNAACLLESLL